MQKEISPGLLRLLKKIKAKRPKIMIDHMLKYGHISTEEIRDRYGYNHPPRAIRDVREYGIPVETFTVNGSDGRKIAAYRFGHISDLKRYYTHGRKALTPHIKDELIKRYGCRCNIYCTYFPSKYLQVDHRVPYEISGVIADDDVNYDEYMLLSASANRLKSWSCEHCDNWKQKELSVCRECYWAFPESYKHVAMLGIRRLDIVWTGEEVASYEALCSKANDANKNITDYVKDIIRCCGKP